MENFTEDDIKYLAYTLLTMTLIGLQCTIVPIVIVSKARRKYFTQNFMDQFLQAPTTDGEDINEPILPAKGGYPDMGSGRYTEKLEYSQWYEYNNAQRVHLNFVEQLPLIQALIFITALKTPLAALILSITYFVLRLVYAVGYAAKGPNFRGFGAVPILLCLVILFGFSFYTCGDYMKHYNDTSVTPPVQSVDGQIIKL
ncbi:mapeg family protein [Stylonychia lemnae]|uniref:Mapeg family protein n=1 Tax=Stylonychia lemnae TaxID=5949 RepID=A0A078ALP2_STYLE|nr:mapeg family protein [Stylonychia lemnae]|eukprot:CDW82791.1 mapeg family protein [Stylonychia lemnae]